jgi:hypothetical protein
MTKKHVTFHGFVIVDAFAVAFVALVAAVVIKLGLINRFTL